MSLITPDFGLLFWMTLILAIVFFVLAKFGFPIITGMVDERNARITESLRKAREAEAALDELSVRQKEMLEQARREQAEILKDAAQARDEMIAQARQQASDEAAKIVSQARLQIAAEKETAMAEVRSQLAELSIAVAEKVMRTQLEDNKAQTDLVNRMVEEMSRSQKLN